MNIRIAEGSFIELYILSVFDRFLIKMISWIRSHIFIVVGLVLTVMILRSTASIIFSLGMSAFFIIPTIVSSMKWIAEISLVLVTYLTDGYIQLYTTSEKKTVITIRRKIKYSSMSCDGKSEGYFFGYEGGIFCGFIQKQRDFRGEIITLYVLTTRNIYEKISENEDHDTVGDEKVMVDFYQRTGSFHSLKYNRRPLDFTNYIVKEEQEQVIDRIVELYQANMALALLFHGIPHTGKTWTARLLAKKLNASFCKSFNPTDPNDSIDLIYAETSPTKNKPLIIVFEEGDRLIEKVYSGTIESHKFYPIAMREKGDWNSFLDDLEMLYPNTIVIITSNRSPEEIIAVTDQSSIRPGRITAQYRFTKQCQ